MPKCFGMLDFKWKYKRFRFLDSYQTFKSHTQKNYDQQILKSHNIILQKKERYNSETPSRSLS